MKRINADYYTEDKYVGYRENRHQVFGKNGTLFAYGIYPTKIKKEDLPNYYVYGYSSEKKKTVAKKLANIFLLYLI